MVYAMIAGIPNVGKSTLFNALTATIQAEAANYPFCTIDANTGRVLVPDERLDVIARLANSPQIVPTALEFVDIAGHKVETVGIQILQILVQYAAGKRIIEVQLAVVVLELVRNFLGCIPLLAGRFQGAFNLWRSTQAASDLKCAAQKQHRQTDWKHFTD